MTALSSSPSTHPSIPPIVVGIGPDEIESALAFAADEAVRVGCGLHLVHAVHVVPSGPETVLLTAVDVEAWGRELLTLAVKRADDLVDGAVPVTHELRRGTPVQVLVEAGRTARMVVLEHRHLSRLNRIVNRTVAGGVAAHLRVPVVAVPSGWTRPAGTPVVVAGVDVPDRSAEVLSAAAAEARARGADLRVVHSWALPVHHDGFVVEDAEHRRWTDRSRAEVRAALDALGDEAVAIEADVVVHPGRAIEAILEASQGAQLLVIGRHDPLVPVGSHIGPVARAVLREATCPVLLASPRSHRAAYRASV
ncbi:Universal stress protein family protein [Nocardioides alpinus]|uniref:Universal stress protein n=1 Tax=Nocardioides alpinus TaxID=748909 RepID=A0A1I0XMS5_9ACTN|nr:universal stress protein [Nocardioides alpinus]PKH44409.1 universal stress protein [Nocardioides alpinus]SFB01488.1 Universal stress protein family protein [Nocardioides alpinus]